MGETTVGGAEVIKNLKEGDPEDDDFGDGKKVTERKMRNMAKAYAWWVAKACLTLVILKVGVSLNYCRLLADIYLCFCAAR